MAKNTPRVQIFTPGANLHPGANCAHERGLSLLFVFRYSISEVCFSLFGYHAQKSSFTCCQISNIMFLTLLLNNSFQPKKCFINLTLNIKIIILIYLLFVSRALAFCQVFMFVNLVWHGYLISSSSHNSTLPFYQRNILNFIS